MDIQTKFNPGDKCWVMIDNKPVPVKIQFATITVGFDASETEIKQQIKYYVYDIVLGIGFELLESELATTKEELKEKIFG